MTWYSPSGGFLRSLRKDTNRPSEKVRTYRMCLKNRIREFKRSEETRPLSAHDRPIGQTAGVSSILLVRMDHLCYSCTRKSCRNRFMGVNGILASRRRGNGSPNRSRRQESLLNHAEVNNLLPMHVSSHGFRDSSGTSLDHLFSLFRPNSPRCRNRKNQAVGSCQRGRHKDSVARGRGKTNSSNSGIQENRNRKNRDRVAFALPALP